MNADQGKFEPRMHAKKRESNTNQLPAQVGAQIRSYSRCAANFGSLSAFICGKKQRRRVLHRLPRS
jgi:hypothetical protein